MPNGVAAFSCGYVVMSDALALQTTMIANAVISMAFYVIAYLIFASLFRERRRGFNALGTATGFVFLTCATGHGLHAVHYAQIDQLDHIAASLPNLSFQAIADIFTAMAGVAYLSQRRRYGLVIRGPAELLDFQRRLEAAEVLREVGQDVVAQTDLDRLLDRAVFHARDLLGADYAVLATAGQWGGPRFGATGIRAGPWDASDWRATGLAVDSSSGSADAAAPPWRPIVVRDLNAPPPNVSREALEIHRAEGARSLLVVPAARGGEILAYLMIGHRRVRRLSRDEVALAEVLASQVAVALENARLIASLRLSDRLKDEFLSSAAHELKTPITTISGWIELLQRGGIGAAAERRAFDIVLRQSRRVTRLVEDLLVITWPQSELPASNRTRFDLKALAREVVDKMNAESGETHIQLTADQPVEIEADRRLIAEALIRLVDNALRYSVGAASIEVVVRGNPGQATVEVTDHGVGISPERQAHVFEPFYEAVPSGEQGYTGLVSLGLSVSERIIRAHGGRIYVVSRPGQGSTFSFTLPAAAAGETARSTDSDGRP